MAGIINPNYNKHSIKEIYQNYQYNPSIVNTLYDASKVNKTKFHIYPPYQVISTLKRVEQLKMHAILNSDRNLPHLIITLSITVSEHEFYNAIIQCNEQVNLIKVELALQHIIYKYKIVEMYKACPNEKDADYVLILHQTN